ncbi:MAG: 2,3-bisphosphoglycerate-independent phosphoglycerate mutase [Myxococcota bacterium]
MNERLILFILDGWGYNPKKEHNAIYLANPKFFNGLWEKYPHSLLTACGLSVGLPDGQMGNSEVGHMNIGAGRIVEQELVKISRIADEGKIGENPSLKAAFDKVKESGGKLHLIGLTSDGGVHSHYKHALAVVKAAKEAGVPDIRFHALLDGRDTPPRSAGIWLAEVNDYLVALGYEKIATICGRYYAMDRDKRWERVELAYLALTEGKGCRANDALSALKAAYDRGENDEFVKPTICADSYTPIQSGDVVINFNFRADRVREITRALTEKEWAFFNRPQKINLATYLCFTEYDKTLTLPVVFPQEDITSSLGEIVAEKGLKQLRIAETEKYAHVTFFFNGGREVRFEGEDRVLVQSPKDVPTYDKKPEMSAFEVTAKLCERIESGGYDFIVCNFANADMVGHTGVESAAIAAVKAVDKCLSKAVPLAQSKGYHILVTADHGNSDEMVDENGKPHTAHTLNKVPFIYLPRDEKLIEVSLSDGILSDIAPTILEIMGIKPPNVMTAKNLIQRRGGR